jgi:hypothetical protein
MEDDPGAGWQPDPAGRHHLRYHDGATFTGYVCDNGVVGVDGDMATGSTDQRQPPSGGSPHLSYVGTFWPGAVAPPPVKRRRVGLLIAIGVAALEGIAIVALSVALLAANSTTSPQPIGSTVSPTGSFSRSMGVVVYSSNFGRNDQWPTGSLNANTSASLSNGEYVVYGWTLIHHPLLTPYSVSHPGISVEAVTTDFSSDNVSMGVGCQSGSGVQPPLVHQLVVYPNGQWYIEEARIPGAVKTIASGNAPALGTTATLQLTCVITETTPHDEITQLVAYINGTRVGAIGDRIGRPFVDGYVPVLLVGSYGPKVHAAFNGISVRSIDPLSVTAPRTLDASTSHSPGD